MNREFVCYLGKLHHPAIGIRIPEIFLTGIFNSLKKNNTIATLMLSFGRETAPEDVINASPGEYEMTLGHTGTSIKRYQTMAKTAAIKNESKIEIEADHLIIIGSSARAVKRIEGVHTEEKISPEQLEKSLQYNYSAVDEAIYQGEVNCFTTDTSDLFWEKATELTDENLKVEFDKMFNENERKRLFESYSGKTFEFTTSDNKKFSIELSDEKIMQLALKFSESININKKIYDYIKERLNRAFGFEISLDETPYKTSVEEIFFYLKEWRGKNLPVDYVAPNVGFKKRTDFDGDADELFELSAKINAVAKSFDGVLLSFHSGSGTSPYSGKGKETYEIILKATEGKLKYKISGVYYELLVEILASYPENSEEKNLYLNIFQEVHKYLKEEIKRDGPLSTSLLKEQLKSHEDEIEKDETKTLNPRADFFRFNSFLALNFRNQEGERYYRKKLVELYQNSIKLREKIDKEVKELTTRLIKGLKFENNLLP